MRCYVSEPSDADIHIPVRYSVQFFANFFHNNVDFVRTINVSNGLLFCFSPRLLDLICVFFSVLGYLQKLTEH